jgi:hypothetical protein
VRRFGRAWIVDIAAHEVGGVRCFLAIGRSATTRSNVCRVASWGSAAKTSCNFERVGRKVRRAGIAPDERRVPGRQLHADRRHRSATQTFRAQRPLPAKSSSTRAPMTRPRELNTACLTRSGVGRTARPFGTRRIRALRTTGDAHGRNGQLAPKCFKYPNTKSCKQPR